MYAEVVVAYNRNKSLIHEVMKAVLPPNAEATTRAYVLSHLAHFMLSCRHWIASSHH